MNSSQQAQRCLHYYILHGKARILEFHNKGIFLWYSSCIRANVTCKYIALLQFIFVWNNPCGYIQFLYKGIQQTEWFAMLFLHWGINIEYLNTTLANEVGGDYWPEIKHRVSKHGLSLPSNSTSYTQSLSTMHFCLQLLLSSMCCSRQLKSIWRQI